MATTRDLDERVEVAIKKVLVDDNPYIKTTALNRICRSGVKSVAYEYRNQCRRECRGVRPLKFFDLPRELRDIVYEYVVTPSEGLAITLNRCFGRGSCADHKDLTRHFQRRRTRGEYYAPGKQPAIARVSRQHRLETLPVFYQANEFVFCLSRRSHPFTLFPWQHSHYVAGVSVIRKWLLAIGGENAQDIRELSLHSASYKDKKALLAMDIVPEKYAKFIHPPREIINLLSYSEEEGQ